MNQSNAQFSLCGRYRWNLNRRFNSCKKEIIFIGLNPSKANSFVNDRTLIRLINFSNLWGYGSLSVVNLFAIISNNSLDLKSFADPIGNSNNKELNNKIKAWSEKELCDLWLGWGVNGSYLNRDKVVLRKIQNYYNKRVRNFPKASQPYAIGITKDGYPRHPLYVQNKTILKPFCINAKKIN
ncbi:DUF1643 domain-containing protein [Prochlorococcus marinus]|uniref:DUF1643 domain-containing protein n=1 Tax=Prochlorococcus marinus TaxID=1219 RepID=UPI0022B59B85|nr:DUF1643 domain-containing protein [Prochlorococcus marinus]